MKNLFNSVQLTRPKSNTFDLTHDVKMSGKIGKLMPCLQIECIPGDKFNIGADSLVRFAPLIAPVMHRVDVAIHYFYVPNRILWPNWEKFVTNEPTGGMPTFDNNGTLTTDQEKFLDYFGIPPFSDSPGFATELNLLPLAAYQCIYNEYFRDENLSTAVDYTLSDGVQPIGIFATMRKRAWEHDYFTAALPFAQKGQAVDIPLGEVELKPDWATNPENPTFKDANLISGAQGLEQPPILPSMIEGTLAPGTPLAYDPAGSLQTGATTINDLRRAFRLQEWLERNARGGTRYIENILAHFGVRSSDARLNRPEYIAGVKTPVVISEVLNTTGEQTGLPQGNMAGHAVSVGNGSTGYYKVEEHGYIIGVVSITPKSCYQQGIPKTFLKRENTDLFWPSFANIGEQEITNNELFAYDVNGTDTFGYTPRYAEYKYMPSRVAGDFRSTLKYWHLGRIFQNQPLLNQSFIEVDDEDFNERIFAVDDGTDNLYMHILHKIRRQALMPVYGTPML